MSTLFALAGEFDSGKHQYRVYEPGSSSTVDWLFPLAKEYVKTLSQSILPRRPIQAPESDFHMDMTRLERYIAKASIPKYKPGNFNVVRSDFGELLCYVLLECWYNTLFGAKSISYRELKDLPGRGIDAIGIERGDPLTIVLCEVKVSDDQKSPPRVVDDSDDCLSKQHRHHLDAMSHATKEKIWRAYRFTKDERIGDLLAEAATYIEEQQIEKLRIVSCNVLIRPKTKYTEADFGSFRQTPADYLPADIRFLIACVPDDLNTLIKDWYSIVEKTGVSG
ncbi:hypothetical protein [Tengunoibacter tsumagoiensis]|uniref:Anti-bacteriophage protein A/HamA C-terminal domain-containing protein n=1 Tax=Tengunoibacter tsumagoiensis TaxID=2014871 RepID=A0A401ZYX8_9CHLR|nr:hypothetical protein [Tengunoibacter tsumagoiensis]GCE12037.1 hypothetical protein KTT_18960 [Tengunoibacter tsumagoiensis]